ncbi:MAG TPA: bifunctional diaminohydroxyphosphoribosylaminopyrimidine deaminase/5-amino-6-(5-phosphoribosylamino)uracil reductase RibD [Oligoflexia bacterium]|nr:bifunctional diaminohydroxyphosphoribosylaminopyrimidine deaminase/5-amino-6-(5-phosphoribosylamino)uracil reductase RibD [Oligoflexia bacterium]HMP47257.1 bifunctional diaminohydroxyphosphoribosylaminopyrimidine deaminase/5-amino-6-(5-phosphoribosylamino)uracil reductase RibD [Oligoflexia bacterium]
MAIFSGENRYMYLALSLARRSYRTVFPNPPVGAILVKNNRIIAFGAHKRFGEAHAERITLSGLSRRDIEGSTMFVTLEPCNHTGNTPPCSELLIDSGVSRIVIGAKDETALAHGGAENLKKKGVLVEYSSISDICEDFVRPWKKWMENKEKSIDMWSVVSLNGQVYQGELNFNLSLTNAINNIQRRGQYMLDHLDDLSSLDAYHVTIRGRTSSDFDIFSGNASSNSESIRPNNLYFIRLPVIAKEGVDWVTWGHRTECSLPQYSLLGLRKTGDIIIEKYSVK